MSIFEAGGVGRFVSAFGFGQTLGGAIEGYRSGFPSVIVCSYWISGTRASKGVIACRANSSTMTLIDFPTSKSHRPIISVFLVLGRLVVQWIHRLQPQHRLGGFEYLMLGGILEFPQLISVEVGFSESHTAVFLRGR